MKKIIARLFGGLGNQLFIYATARRLSLINDIPLFLDVYSGFQTDPFGRKFALHHFNIQAKIASKLESLSFIGGKYLRYAIKNLNKYLNFKKRFYLTEEHQDRFDERMLNIKVKYPVLYLEGYWQSEKYFKDIEEIIRDDLQIITPISNLALEEAKIIEKTLNSVCLGIRLYQEEKKYAHFVMKI